MVEKLKLTSSNCPKGVFAFCAITGKGILNDNNGGQEYKVTLEVDEDLAGPLMDDIDDFIEDSAPKRKELTKVPYQTHDDYDGIPEGKVWFYAKTSTTWTDSKSGEVNDKVMNVYDSQGNKVTLPEGMGVGKGSTGKVFGAIDLWEQGKEYGCTIWLSGIQIANFVSYEFEESVEAMEGGSFKGFNTPQLEKDEVGEDEAPKTSRRSRRDRSDEGEDEAPAGKTRRRRRS